MVTDIWPASDCHFHVFSMFVVSVRSGLHQSDLVQDFLHVVVVVFPNRASSSDQALFLLFTHLEHFRFDFSGTIVE